MLKNLANNLYSVKQVYEIEATANQEANMSSWDLMQSAGAAAFNRVKGRWQDLRKLVVVCGKGNNGGDGLIVADLAKKAGFEVKVLLVFAEAEFKGAALQAYQQAKNNDVVIQEFSEIGFAGCELIIDAVLGTGLKGRVRDGCQQVIDLMNKTTAPKLSLDVPSGLSADCGCIFANPPVQADVTVTFIVNKKGLATGAGLAYCGKVYLENLGIKSAIVDKFIPYAQIINKDISTYFSPRKRDAHKGDFGHVVVIGGNHGMPGAIQMAAMAAQRTGAGLVSVLTRKAHINLAASAPSIMWRGVEDVRDAAVVDALIANASVLVIGPGLGQDAWAISLFKRALASDLPKVIDADALNLLAKQPQTCKQAIITPHPGEAARLLDISSADIQNDRYLAVSKLFAKYQAVTVLKGSGTLIKSVDKDILKVCTSGNPGMATAGMGDILCGVIAGLLAQNFNLQLAAEIGVELHAQAGDMAVANTGERGLIATDLLPEIHKVVNLGN